MRITALTYVEGRDAEPDAVVAQVVAALRRKGHTVSVLGVHDDVRRLVAGVGRRRPDLVFNLMEMFGDDLCGDVAVTGLLELLGVPYTGGGPNELPLAQDKAVAKKLLAFDGVPYPRYAVFSSNADFETGGNLRMPLFVKPQRADASIGIDARSLVHDAGEMMKRVLHIHREVGDAALVEEYVDGRELYVGVIGNVGGGEGGGPVALPVIEMDFSGLPDGAPHVLDGAAKFDTGSAAYRGTRARVADLSDELRARVQKTALDAYRALRVRDYGRVDLRLTEAGELYVIEVNANCYLEKEGELAMAASAAGIEYDDLIDRIATMAVARRGRGRAERVRRTSTSRGARGSSPAP